MKFYQFIYKPGGESFWLERISKLSGSEIIRFWDESQKNPMLTPHGFFNRIVFKFLTPLEKTLPDVARGLYALFGVFTYILNNEDSINIVSSTFIPLPRGRNVIAYVHTPSRFLTIDFQNEVKKIQGNIPKRLFYLVWRAIYFYLYKSSFSRAGLIVVNSRNIQDRLMKYFKLKSVLIYPSINVSSFRNEKFGDYFFYPSRIMSYKRQLYVLRAFKEFCDSENGFRLILAGSSSKIREDALYFLEVKEYIEKNELPVEIILDASGDEIISLYANAYLTLFAGRDEDFGNIPIESMASSKPIISVKEGGPVETIKDGINGFLVNSESEMASKMLELVKDPIKAKKMGGEGRQYVEENFDDQAFLEHLSVEIRKCFANL